MTFKQYFYQLNETDSPQITFGQLKQAILSASKKKFVGQLATHSSGLIPGAEVAQTAATIAKKYLDPNGQIMSTLKRFMSVADNLRGNNLLSKLDIDDDASEIVSDDVEDNFVKYIIGTLNNFPDEEVIPPDWNMTKELIRYLSTTYNGRTLSIPTQNISQPTPTS